jgi:DNA polymerase-3 subunit delta'
MIHSILITGGDSQSRLEKAFQIIEGFLGKKITNHPDFILIEAENSIKIGQIRELKKKLSLKPYLGKMKVALISNADQLTLPAQHSLLKTLEEPPAASIIILTAQTKESLLPTILSRCQVISLGQKFFLPADKSLITNYQLLITKILKSSPGERILIAEEYSQNREQAVEFCQIQLLTLRKILRKRIFSPSSNVPIIHITQAIHQVQQSLELLKSNVNPQFVIGNLLLLYPKSIKIKVYG